MTAKGKKVFGFALVLRGADVTSPENLDALYEARCSDATFGVSNGVSRAEFDREHHSFAGAVLSAIHDVEGAVSGLRVTRVEPDDWVTASAIAARTGRTRESVRLLVEGRRGPGSFPRPVTWVDAKSRVWKWSEVARWFAEALGERPSDGAEAAVIAATNDALSLRAHSRYLRRTELKQVLKLVA